ncbi:MAG: hypothetical protein ACE5IA_01790 [Dehalococcoidia bacterium]
MYQPDEDILRVYFRLEEYQSRRMRMQRIWHPELMNWAKRGAPPPLTETKRIRREELARMGFGEEHYQRMVAGEQETKALLCSLAQKHPLWAHFERIRAFGPYVCGAFIAAGGDIARAPTVSAFWKGMGLDVLPDGTVPRRIRGRRNVPRPIPALPHVTRVGEQIRQQILRGQGKLADIYYQKKEEYWSRHPDRIKNYAHLHGLRMAQKLLYACLWEQWRQAYGLPATWPYAFAILRHHQNGCVRIHDLYDR